MRTIELTTDLHCDNCVAKLRHRFDGISGIRSWQADLNDPHNTVTVTGELEQDEVIALIREAGYTARPVTGKAAGNTFWNDTRIWHRSAFNTMNCLVGCSIGDFGMIVYLQAAHPAMPMFLQMVLATIAGLMTSVLLETLLLNRREKMAWPLALRTAMAMSFLSMVAMEVAMNLTDLMITGGRLPISDHRFWLAFIPSAIAGFLAPWPYNYFRLKKHGMACH